MKDLKDSTEFLLKNGHSMNYYPEYGYKFYDGEDNCILLFIGTNKVILDLQ